jgi:hypothetical protein
MVVFSFISDMRFTTILQKKLIQAAKIQKKVVHHSFFLKKNYFRNRNKNYHDIMLYQDILPEKQQVIINFAGWAIQNKLYQNLYFGLIFDGRKARFL